MSRQWLQIEASRQLMPARPAVGAAPHGHRIAAGVARVAVAGVEHVRVGAQDGVVRAGRPRQAPVRPGVIGPVQRAAHISVEGVHLRPPDRPARPTGRQQQRAGRRTDLQRGIVHVGAADAACAVVVGAELQADRFARVTANVQRGRHGPPGGVVSTLHQQPVNRAVLLDDDRVEEVAGKGGRGQLGLVARQFAQVRQRALGAGRAAVAVDVVAPEAQLGRGSHAGEGQRRDADALVNGGVALHVGRAGGDASAHAARPTVHRRRDVGGQDGIRADDPPGVGLEAAIDQPLIAGRAGRDHGCRRGGRRRCGCPRGRWGDRRRARGRCCGRPRGCRRARRRVAFEDQWQVGSRRQRRPGRRHRGRGGRLQGPRPADGERGIVHDHGRAAPVAIIVGAEVDAHGAACVGGQVETGLLPGAGIAARPQERLEDVAGAIQQERVLAVAGQHIRRQGAGGDRLQDRRVGFGCGCRRQRAFGRDRIPPEGQRGAGHTGRNRHCLGGRRVAVHVGAADDARAQAAAAAVHDARAVTRRVGRGRDLPGQVLLEAAVDQPLFAAAAVMPDAGVRGHVHGQTAGGVRRDRQVVGVGVSGRVAEFQPGVATVHGTVKAVRVAGHELPAEGGEECAVNGVTGRNRQRPGEGFIDPRQPGGGKAPGGAAVGGAQDAALRRVVAGAFDGSIGVPGRAIGSVVGRDGQPVGGAVGVQALPGDAAIGAAANAAIAGGQQRAVAGVGWRRLQLEDEEALFGRGDGVARPRAAAVGGFVQHIHPADEHGAICGIGWRERQRPSSAQARDHRPTQAAVGGFVERRQGQGAVFIGGENGAVAGVARRDAYVEESVVVAGRTAGDHQLPA